MVTSLLFYNKKHDSPMYSHYVLTHPCHNGRVHNHIMATGYNHDHRVSTFQQRHEVVTTITLINGLWSIWHITNLRSMVHDTMIRIMLLVVAVVDCRRGKSSESVQCAITGPCQRMHHRPSA